MADETTPAPLSDAEIAEITELAAKATPGQWHYGDWPGSVYAGQGQHWVADVGRDAENNGLFIAAARTDIPRLLATLAAYREIVAAVAGEDIVLSSSRLNVEAGGWTCHYCDNFMQPLSARGEERDHSPDCLIATAKRALLGTPAPGATAGEDVCELCNGTGVYVHDIAWENPDRTVGTDTKRITCHGCNGTGKRRAQQPAT